MEFDTARRRALLAQIEMARGAVVGREGDSVQATCEGRGAAAFAAGVDHAAAVSPFRKKSPDIRNLSSDHQRRDHRVTT